MAEAKKLPSGTWKLLVYDYTDSDGKQHYKSFTNNHTTPTGNREIELAAVKFASERKARFAMQKIPTLH